MPRPPRIIIPGQPLHVIQRGCNRSNVFLDTADFDKCLSLLRSGSAYNRCAIHAYVVMNNHLHMLVTPADEFGPSKFMQSFESSYAEHFNERYERTGPLWDGRYHSFLVDSEKYFLTCSRYIELNPVRALMVDQPGEYVRSSFRCNAQGVADPLVTTHSLYDALGGNGVDSRHAYTELFEHHLDEAVLEAIRHSAKTGKTLDGKITATE